MDAVEQVVYKSGMLDHPREARGLTSRRFHAPGIPDEVLQAIERERFADLGGVYGDPTWGDPIQYDEVRVTRAGETTSVRVFNRALLLFHADSEVHRRIHRVCETLRTATSVRGSSNP